MIHITLLQANREEVVGYLTHANIATEQGVSFPVSWTLQPAPLPADTAKFEADEDPNWGERKRWPFADFRKATQHVRSWFPRAGQPSAGVIDEWLCLRNGENWTNESLGSVVDTFPQVVETLALPEDPYGVEAEKREGAGEAKAGFWYPTLLLNLDVKKALPEAGVKWLFVRLQAKMIRNGRFDLEIMVSDESGHLVALSHHVCFVVGAERNLAARRKEGESKL